MLADSEGAIAWVANGPLPRRIGFDGSRPESLANGSRAWDGWLEPPRRLGGDDDVLLTANSRTLPRADADAVSRMWMRALRAKRIADLLGARRTFNERDFLAMQLDTRAEGYEQIRAAVLAAVPADDREPLLRRGRAHVEAWNGNADVDQPGFRILHSYYRLLLARALEPLVAPASAAERTFVYRWPLADEALRRLLDEQPAHLLTREYSSWNDFLRAVFAEALQTIEGEPNGPGLDASWGTTNTLEVRHPFAGQFGPVAGWLSLPAAPLPGSMISLRVAAPSYGAVVRMVVSPGAPGDGVLELAGGQSGHFLSPQFRDFHGEWLEGRPTPFLAGEEVARIVLRPGR
jgi:penicillin amidase